jgi:hypothetical protein
MVCVPGPTDTTGVAAPSDEGDADAARGTNADVANGVGTSPVDDDASPIAKAAPICRSPGYVIATGSADLIASQLGRPDRGQLGRPDRGS